MPTPSIDLLLKLPKKRRMEIAERLWLSAVDEQDAVVPIEHKQTVAARLAAYRSGETQPVDHAELMRKLRAQ